jgi:flavin-dependent dehydrogenase
MFNPFGTGWHLDRAAFDARLLAAAGASGVTLRSDPGPGAGAGIAAPVVVDASGRRAHHARRRGARRIADDRLIAVLTTCARRGDDVDATTTVEAAETGWWYTCPIPRQRRVVAFLTDGDLLPPAWRTGSGLDAAARRTTHIASLLGPTLPGAPLVVAAGTARLDPPCGDGWLAAGDAAASFDPLSSQGILTAVLMGAEVARGIDDTPAFAARYQAIVAEYETQRLAIYRREERWPDAPFWARRHRHR